VKTNSPSLTNQIVVHGLFHVKHQPVKVLINKAFRYPRALPPPGGRRRNRKVAGAKTDVFRSLFHTKTPRKHANPINFRESVATKD